MTKTAVIRWNGSTTEIFPIGKGVRQGCILSPQYVHGVMREAEIHDLRYNIGGRYDGYSEATSKEPVCPRVELILKIIIILLIIFLGFIKSKPC